MVPPMAEETGKTGLAWVQEPTISDGHVVYKYRNSSDTDATFVGEMVNVMPAAGSNVVQTFQLDGLAAGAEQETYAPSSSDLPDGKATVVISIQSFSGGDAWDGQLEYEVNGVIVGGALRPEGDAPAGTGTLVVEAVDVRLDGEELVLHYRVTGDTQFDVMSVSVTMFDPQGGSGWMQSFGAEPDREDIFRTRIPFDEVLGTDEGWAIEATVLAGSTQSDVTGAVRIRLPVERVDETVVAPSGWTAEPLG